MDTKSQNEMVLMPSPQIDQGMTLTRPEQMGVFASSENFETAQRMAIALSKSTIVPKAYQATHDNPNAVSNCIIALEVSGRIGASPMLVMQNLYVVHGNPGWSSKFLIACLNTCGRFTAIQYEFTGTQGKDDWGCRAWAIERATGTAKHGAWVTIEMAKKEGWYNKSGSKWQTMPELMLQYRAAAFFQRAYAPEISMGMHTVEEITDIQDAVYVDDAISGRTEFDASKLHTESDVHAAMLRGHIGKEEADAFLQEIVRRKAKEDISESLFSDSEPQADT